MNLWLRLLAVVASALRKPRTHPFDEHTIDVRIWPSDLDVNGHVNNGRFLSLLDLGRTDHTVRSGLFQAGRKQGFTGVVAAATIRYRQQLRTGQTVQMKTRLLGWDERSFFVAQKIERRGKLAAVALLRLRVIGRQGTLAPALTLEAFGLPAESPPLPAPVSDWQRSEAGLERLWGDPALQPAGDLQPFAP